MTRLTPEEHVTALCREMGNQRDALDRQIAVLRGAIGGPGARSPGDLVLVLYLSTGSAHQVVDFADAQGWRLPGAKGNERRYIAMDVYKLIRSEPCAIPPPGDGTLQGMALAKLKAHGGMRLPGIGPKKVIGTDGALRVSMCACPTTDRRGQRSVN